jgi:hypothetical protein
MRTPMMTVWRVGTYSVLSAAVVAALTGGCGGDDVTSSDSGSTSDAGADQTDVTTPDASRPDASQLDSSQPDASYLDSSRPDASQLDSSQPDASYLDSFVRQDVVGMDTAATDGNDAAGDSSDALGPRDSSDGGVCSTTVAHLAAGGDGGLADSGSDAEAAAPIAPQLLFGFDNPGGLDLAWSGYTSPNTISSALLGETLSDGYTCTGALEYNVTYSGYNVTSGVLYNYGAGGVDWTGRTRLHAWIKLTTSDYTTLSGVQLIVESNNYAVKRYGGFLTATTLAVGTWHEAIVSLGTAATDYFPTNVNDFQVQLLTPGAQADGGPAAPSPATLLVDDIWLE